MTSREQQLILELLEATEQIVMLADTLSKKALVMSKEDAERLHQEIEMPPATTMFRSVVRIRLSTGCSTAESV